MKNLIGVILAGGKSQRFKSDKAKSIFQGNSFLNIATDLLQEFLPEVWVIGRKDTENYPNINSNIEWFSDLIPGLGPLGGLYTALQKARGHSILVTPCDMPFLGLEILTKLIKHRNPNSIATLALLEGEEQFSPLIGIYESKALPYLDKAIQNSQKVNLPHRLSVKSIFQKEPCHCEPWRSNLSSHRLSVKSIFQKDPPSLVVFPAWQTAAFTNINYSQQYQALNLGLML